VTRIVWAPQALDDVQAIRDYLYRDAVEYANLVTELIVAAVGRLDATLSKY
jgi:plasmid stabilization system protein ParE